MPAVVVNPVGFALFQAVAPEATIANVPPLNVKFLVPKAVVAVVVQARLKPLRSTVPFVKVNVDTDELVKYCHAPPTPLKLMLGAEIKVVVEIVFVPDVDPITMENELMFEELVDCVKFPYIVRLPVNVLLPADIVKSRTAPDIVILLGKAVIRLKLMELLSDRFPALIVESIPPE